MDIIKKYPLGQLFGKPNKNIDFALLTSDELLKLIKDKKNAHVHQYHKHDFYMIFWIEEGEIYQKLDNKEYLLKRGDVFISSAGQVHEKEENITHIKGGAILFDGAYLNRLKQNHDISELTFLDNASSCPRFHFSETAFTVFLSIIQAIFKEINNEVFGKAIVKSLVSAVLLSIQQTLDTYMMQITSNRHIEVYKKFRAVLEQSYKEHKSLGFYAEALCVSQRHLNRMLKDTTSKTATELLQDRILLEAKRLLSFTDKNISEIALHLGYDDNSYFTKIFKKETGVTPHAYRASMS